MTTINKSILNKNNFRLLIDKIPTVEYYVKTVNIPGLQFSEVAQPAGIGLDAFFPGDKVAFDTLDVTFLVDEDLENFKEVYDWMDSIVPVHNPEDYKNFTNTLTTEQGQLSTVENALNQYSDITLVINTNKNLANRYFRFKDCFPIALGALELESGADNEPVTCQVQFRFTYYEIKSTS